MNTTTNQPKPITKRAYKMLVNKTYRAEHKGQWDDAAKAEGLKLRAKLEAYSVACSGEAHSNGFIDNCMVCLHGAWGLVQNPELRK